MKTLKSVIIISLSFLAGTGFYACKDNSNDAVLSISQQDRTFVRKASQANTAEIKFGGLALQKSKNDSITAFAQKMITDHSKSKRELDSVIQVMTLVKQDSMDVAHDTLFAKLSRIAPVSFDTAYINSQVRDHKAAQALLQDEINKGSDKGLKWYSNKALPEVTNHLLRATNIQTYIQSQRP